MTKTHTASLLSLIGIARLVTPLLVTYACAAQSAATPWPIECVGRLQIRFPGNVETAAVSPADFVAGRSDPDFRFDDGQLAGFSRLQYGGVVIITRALQKNELDLIRATENRWVEAAKNGKTSLAGANANAKTSVSPRFERLSPVSDTGLAWRNGERFVAFDVLENHATKWVVTGIPEQRDRRARNFRAFVGGLRFRPILTVPDTAGVCLPYAFVEDNGNDAAGRVVAATYRLRDHPDVTIMLEDASASAPAAFQDPTKFTAIYKSNFFWAQRYQSVKSRENLLHGSYHKIKFAGQHAVETMFKLTREDNTQDFGYLVVTRGDPDAKVDTPDLMMYVIQNAQHAVAKGIKPMEKDKFFEMAKAIAASVKPREIK